MALADELGMVMKTKVTFRGFTLVELMIGVAIFAILMMMASPMIVTYLENRKIRNVAESIVGGMQKARANAVKKNAPTEFVLAADGMGWTIWELDATVTPATRIAPALEAFSWGAGGQNNWATVSFTVAPAGQNTITFDGIGRLLSRNLSGATPPPNSIAVNTTSAIAGLTQLQVDVNMTGGVRVCAPNLPAADPKGCGFVANP